VRPIGFIHGGKQFILGSAVVDDGDIAIELISKDPAISKLSKVVQAQGSVVPWWGYRFRPNVFWVNQRDVQLLYVQTYQTKATFYFLGLDGKFRTFP